MKLTAGTEIRGLPLSTRAINVLRAECGETVGEVRKYVRTHGAVRLRMAPNCGARSFSEICEVLAIRVKTLDKPYSKQAGALQALELEIHALKQRLTNIEAFIAERRLVER